MRSTELNDARLAMRRSGSRYALVEVDSFLDECAASLQAWEQQQPAALCGDDLVVKQFRSVPFFAVGYDADAVDDLLDTVAVQLRAYETASAE